MIKVVVLSVIMTVVVMTGASIIGYMLFAYEGMRERLRKLEKENRKLRGGRSEDGDQ